MIVRITIGALVILIAAAMAMHVDQLILTVLFRLLVGVLLVVSLLEVVGRSMRLRLAFQRGWVVGKRQEKVVVRITEQPRRFWTWTVIEGVFLLVAIASAAFWVWLLTQGWG